MTAPDNDLSHCPEHWQRYSKQRYSKHKGFTLLELLVVVVIVAILFSYTTLAIRGDSPEDIIKKEAIRLKLRVELAMDEAILRGEEYAIEIHQNGYLFLRYTRNQWTPITGDKVLQQRELPLDMELEMRLEETEIVIDPSSGKKPAAGGTKSETSRSGPVETEPDEAEQDKAQSNEFGNEKAANKPQIFLLSSGEITPEFEIRFYILGIETSYLVKGLFDGTVTSEISEL
jgi:type II secretion system protein H